MRNNGQLILTLGFLLLASGCKMMLTSVRLPDPASSPVPNVDTIDTVIAMGTESAAGTSDVLAAIRVSTQTPSLEPTITPTEPPAPRSPTPTLAPAYQQKCLPVQDLPPDGLRQNGVIVLGGMQARLYNLKTLGKPVIPLAISGSYFEFLSNNSAVSPDGKKFIYLEGSPDPKGYIPMRLALRIVRADGRRVAVSQPWDPRWNAIVSWFDPETLLMAWDISYKGRMTVVNPFTGQARDLEPTFPDVYQSHLPGTTWDNATNAVYSPDQTQVVYLRDDRVDPEHQIVLWDVKSRAAVWQRPDRGALAHTPRWSPDGTAFAVALDGGTGKESQDELFLVNREGDERQLTHLATTGDKAVFRGLTWSPDGQSLAFWLDYRHAVNAYETEELGVLDLAGGQITLFCFGTGSARPVWALDSLALAFEIDPVNLPIQTILLDLQRGNAYKLADNTYPAAWLKTP